MKVLALTILLISQALTISVMFGNGIWKINWKRIKPLKYFTTFDERDIW